MELIKMLPEQLREAVKSQIPLLLPIGAYEYHGEHMPLGTDTLIAEGICRRISQKIDAVIAPPLYFTPTMNWAAGIEDGDVDFSPDALYAYVKEYLSKLIDMGFRRIYAMIGHQGKNGLPAVTVKRAFLDINRERAHKFGAGWGGLRQTEAAANVNADGNFFNIVSVCDYDEYIDYSKICADEHMPVGHGGKGETQLITALYEGLVKMENIKSTDRHIPDWLNDVWQASKEEGEFWVDLCVTSWVKHLQKI